MPKSIRITSSAKKKKTVDIARFIKGRKRIFDVGTGPIGSYWWKLIDEDARITGIEKYFFPKEIPTFVKVYKLDVDDLGKMKSWFIASRLWLFDKFFPEKVQWIEKFDFVVANHVLEHVNDFQATVAGISRLLEKGGRVYVGFPDHRNFTDIFYHLIQPDSGGHLQLLTDEIVKKEFEKNGLQLISRIVWPDDWLWFEKQYNWKSYMWKENTKLTQEKVKYLADVFRKELTPDKGYFYGWEMVFEKTK